MTADALITLCVWGMFIILAAPVALLGLVMVYTLLVFIWRGLRWVYALVRRAAALPAFIN